MSAWEWRGRSRGLRTTLVVLLLLEWCGGLHLVQ
jgi:hypothetical protein